MKILQSSTLVEKKSVDVSTNMHTIAIRYLDLFMFLIVNNLKNGILETKARKWFLPSIIKRGKVYSFLPQLISRQHLSPKQLEGGNGQWYLP